MVRSWLARKVNIGTSQKVVFSYNIKAPQTIQEFIFHTDIDWSDRKIPNNSNMYQMPTHNNLFLIYWRGTQSRRFVENDPYPLLMLLSTSKRKYPPFPLLSYFSVVVCLRCLLHHILSLIFHYYCAVYDECKKSDTFWLADGIRLFVHYTISLSSLCRLIWRHWTYKISVRYILSSVCVRLSIFSQLSIIQYVGLCVFSLPISLVMIETVYIYFALSSSSNRKYELLSIV